MDVQMLRMFSPLGHLMLNLCVFWVFTQAPSAFVHAAL